MTLADGARADDAKSVLAEVGVTDLSDDRRTIDVRVSDGGQALLDAVRRLDAAAVAVASVAVREPTLDDVFLQLTGQPVSLNERPQEVRA